MALLADGTNEGQAVLDDLKRGIGGGHGVGLQRAVRRQFGRIELATGWKAFYWNADRIGLFLRKLTRGVHSLLTDRFLPDTTYFEFDFFTRYDAERFQKGVLTGPVSRTGELMPYPTVFSARALCFPGDLRAHAYVFVLWGQCAISASFHDPSCPCDGHQRDREVESAAVQ